MSEQLKLEREARQRETEQRETAQRMLRQLTAKTRVSSSHQESVENLLKDREAEIRKLRHLLTEARQRSTTALIPRVTSPALSKSAVRSSRTNQNDENESPARAKLSMSAGAASPAAPPPYLRKRNSSSLGSTRGATKARTEPMDGSTPAGPTSAGASPTPSSSSRSSVVTAAVASSRTRRASSLRSLPSETSARAWK